MSKSLFEQYEDDRKYFKPGTILITKGNALVQEIKILGPSLFSIEEVKLEILRADAFYMFGVGCINDWHKKYIKTWFQLKESSNV